MCRHLGKALSVPSPARWTNVFADEMVDEDAGGGKDGESCKEDHVKRPAAASGSSGDVRAPWIYGWHTATMRAWRKKALTTKAREHTSNLIIPGEDDKPIIAVFGEEQGVEIPECSVAEYKVSKVMETSASTVPSGGICCPGSGV